MTRATTKKQPPPPTNDNAAAVKQAPMWIEWVPLDQLQTWPGNPKRHDEELLEGSFARFGFVDPIIFDETSKQLVAGHGRRKTLFGMYKRGEPVPERVQVRESDGMWLVPVLRGIAFKSAQDAEAYLLVNNQAVIKSGYDELALAEMLRRHAEDITDLGWSKQDAEDLFARVEKMTAGTDVEVPEDFKEFDEGQKAGHDCPQCGFRVTCDRP